MDTLTKLQRSGAELERTLGQMLKKKRLSKLILTKKLREESASGEGARDTSEAPKTPRMPKPLPTPKALPTPPEKPAKPEKFEKSVERDKTSDTEHTREVDKDRERGKEREREEKEREKERARAAKAERKASKHEARASKAESRVESKPPSITLPGFDGVLPNFAPALTSPVTNIILVGFSGVGRSSLLERMSKGGFSETSKPTGALCVCGSAADPRRER